MASAFRDFLDDVRVACLHRGARFDGRSDGSHARLWSQHRSRSELPGRARARGARAVMGLSRQSTLVLLVRGGRARRARRSRLIEHARASRCAADRRARRRGWPPRWLQRAQRPARRSWRSGIRAACSSTTRRRSHLARLRRRDELHAVERTPMSLDAQPSIDRARARLSQRRCEPQRRDPDRGRCAGACAARRSRARPRRGLRGRAALLGVVRSADRDRGRVREDSASQFGRADRLVPGGQAPRSPTVQVKLEFARPVVYARRFARVRYLDARAAGGRVAWPRSPPPTAAAARRAPALQVARRDRLHVGAATSTSGCGAPGRSTGAWGDCSASHRRAAGPAVRRSRRDRPGPHVRAQHGEARPWPRHTSVDAVRTPVGKRGGGLACGALAPTSARTCSRRSIERTRRRPGRGRGRDLRLRRHDRPAGRRHRAHLLARRPGCPTHVPGYDGRPAVRLVAAGGALRGAGR